MFKAADGWRAAISAVLLVFGLSFPASSQHSPPGGAPGPGLAGVPTTRSTPTSTTDNSTYANTLGTRGIYLSGKVQMEDGAPPPEEVLIERVCGGRRKAEAYADTKGRFSFQLGREEAITADASFENSTGAPTAAPRPMNTPPSGPVGSSSASQSANNSLSGTTRDLTGCELTASLPGFRSDSVNLDGRHLMDNPDLGTLILHRMAGVEGTTISVTTLQAPKVARKAYDKARQALRKEKDAEAQKEFAKAVEIYPKFADAWYQLGLLQAKGNDLAEARKSYSQAVQADPKFVSPYLPLALLAAREKNWQDLAATTDRLLKLDAFDFPEAYYYNAAANFNLQKFEDAEESARQAVKLDTAHRYPQVIHLLGVILYQKKDYAGAAVQFRNYQRLAPNAPDAEQVKSRLAELDRLAAQADSTPPQQP